MGGSAGSESGGAGGAEPVSGDGTCESPLSLGSAVGDDVAVGRFDVMGNEFDVCPGMGGELHFSWRAPRPGRFAFRTDGSDFDTVLFAQRGEVCAEPVDGACNDDYYGLQSLVALDVAEGESVWVVLDSFPSIAAADFRLEIQEEATCPSLDASGLTGAVVVSDDFRFDSRPLPLGGVSECGGGPLGFTLAWQASEEGVYRFSVEGNPDLYDPVLAVRDSCGGALLACDDDGGAAERAAEVVLPVGEGETVSIEVGSYEGPVFEGAEGPVVLDVEAL
jgi:hypothetical protein